MIPESGSVPGADSGDRIVSGNKGNADKSELVNNQTTFTTGGVTPKPGQGDGTTTEDDKNTTP